MSNLTESYYKVVSDYYDQDVEMGFEKRAHVNVSLNRIRNDFRRITEKFPFRTALEIGCGPGFDLAWFAGKYPERQFFGVDISSKMVNLAQKRIDTFQFRNATAIQSDERNLMEHFQPGQFDLVYVYFGALNTVNDLDYAADQIHELLSPGGFAALTFVNKWYAREMIVQLLKLRFDLAFSRLRKEWGGYSPDRFLPSHCYNPAQIQKIFSRFIIRERKGYSIVFPAWYNYKKIISKKKKADLLWKTDQLLQKTFFWSFGEYTLFVFQKP